MHSDVKLQHTGAAADVGVRRIWHGMVGPLMEGRLSSTEYETPMC
jgi:hypothetical protein